MSSELSLIEIKSLATDLKSSSFIPDDKKKSVADLQVILMTGTELGLGPMQSIRGIHVISGKPSLSAELIAALCCRHPSFVKLHLDKSTATEATYTAQRKDSTPTTLSFTMAQAMAAGITGNPNWKKYPEAMLRARCVAAICRVVWPDAVGGLLEDSEAAEIKDVTPEESFSYTPSNAPKASPPIDGTFAEVESDGLKAFKLAIGACLTVSEMEACWKAADKGDHDQQAKMTAAYKLRKAEITAPKEPPTVAAEMQVAS